MNMDVTMYFVAAKMVDTEYGRHEYTLKAGPFYSEAEACKHLYTSGVSVYHTPVVVSGDVPVRDITECK